MMIPAFDFRNNRNKGIIAFLLFLAIVFNVFRNSEQTTLLAVILIVVSFGLYASVYGINVSKETSLKDRSRADLDVEKEVLNRTIANEGAAPFDTYAIKSFPKTGLKYLRENEDLYSVAQNLLYLRVYDKSRYQDLLLLMDRLQKIYIYTLVGRYNCQHGLTLFMDIRELLRETLYSFYIVTPMKTRHMYGLDPHGELDRSIRAFTSLTRRMIRIVENYGRRECKAAYLDPTVPKALDPGASPNTMP